MGNGSFNRHKARPIHNPCHPQRHCTQAARAQATYTTNCNRLSASFKTSNAKNADYSLSGKDSIGTQLDNKQKPPKNEEIPTCYTHSYQNLRSARQTTSNNTKSSMKRITRNPFAELESWKDHFSNIQDGAVPVANRVWDSIPQNPNTATWLNETLTIPELTRALAKMIKNENWQGPRR